MKKILLIFSLITILQATTVEQLFNVKTVKVTMQNIEKSRTYNGYVEIIDENIYAISPTQDGFIKGLTKANIYDNIVKGEKLFEIYSPEVYKAQIELLSAKQVSRSLAKKIEKKLELYDVAKRNIKMIKRANRAFKYLPYYSPYSGIVISKHITSGSAVKKGEELYRVADLSKVWVVAKAYESDRAYIKKGAKVQVTLNGSKKVYDATIDFIYPIVDRVNKTIDFRITLKNPNGTLQPNSYVTIKSIINNNSILVLPNTAVVTKGSRHLVFVAGEYEGEYKTKEIEAKRISNSKFEILSGLKEGEEVVNNALFLIDSDVLIND